MEACGREHWRGAETTPSRTAGTDSDVRRTFAQHAEAGRSQNPAGELSRPRKTAVCGSGGELSRGMPVCAGDAARRLSQRRAGAGTRAVAGRPAALPPRAQRPVDETTARLDGDAVFGAQDGTEFRAGQSDLLFIESLAEADAFPRTTRRTARQQHRRTGSEESDSEPQERALLQNAERRRGGRSVHEPDPHLRAEWGQ